jgi:hypothetical protein
MATQREEGNLGKAYPAPSVTVFYDRGRCRPCASPGTPSF